jgi:hypothetical protein
MLLHNVTIELRNKHDRVQSAYVNIKEKATMCVKKSKGKIYPTTDLEGTEKRGE